MIGTDIGADGLKMAACETVREAAREGMGGIVHLPAVMKGNEMWRSQVHRAHMLDITALRHDRLLTGRGGAHALMEVI